MQDDETVASDIAGMTKAAPFSRRGFMTAAAATAAGYTIAAGEVRAEAIHTDTAGLDTGDAARRLAKLGAFAVAPDYYFRSGVDLTKFTDFKAIMPIVNAKPDAELVSDLDAAVAWAKGQGGDTSRLGIVGFCRGGRTVWVYAAHSDVLKAGVT